MTASIPHLIVVFSGKRKSGKDYVTDLLLARLPVGTSSILRLSQPLKAQYAKEHGLDADRLLDSSEYKERCRGDMIRWGEERRKLDPAFFIKAIANGPGSDMPVWIVSDARRRTDIESLSCMYGRERLVLVRVTASDTVRADRGWVYTQGVDDVESECDLDLYEGFDLMMTNEGDSAQLNTQISHLINIINSKTTSSTT